MTAHDAAPATTFALIRTLVLYSVAEHQLGHATTIRVDVDGDRFSVSDDGRGHAIARTIAGAPYLKFIYNHLDYPYTAAESAPIQLQGLAMSLLNVLCCELEVTVRKRDATLRLSFRRGQLQRHVVDEAPAVGSGNIVAGRVDAAMAGAAIDHDALAHWLRGIVAVHPALCIVVNGEPLASH